MFTYRLEAQNGLPLYEALYRHIRQDILSGALTAGERLPSKRSLAEHLQISVMTVETAYHQLEAEGYLYALPKRGFFVSAVDHLPTPAAPTAIPPEPEAPKWHLDLGRNQVDSSRFPAAAWARLTRQVLSEGNFLAPVPQQGLYALRQAIARDLWDFKGMAVAPEQIVVGAGAEYLYLLLAQLLGANGRTVFAVEEPGYPKIRQVYGKCGIVCRPVPLDCQGMDPEALAASGAMAAHISPAHHYPTGLVTPIGRRHALLRWAEASDGFIIEDDYDSEFRFTGRPIPTLQSIDSGGRVIYLNTFSQTISPSMRVGFMVLPPTLLERYRMELNFYAAEHGLTVVDEYIDDGWSGTNFERPSFQRMIDDIEDGKINCVVTKDLSRLGRNYILTGQYTEIYFPSKGVRYIAINDNVDTINGESELAPFLNILNEMHARQTSKKVKAAMHTRFANGAHYGAYAPLGYVKDPDKKGHLLIDPETRWIVEKIFDLAVHGRGAASITRILVEEKVPTPGWLNYERYGTFANIYAGAPAEKAYAWTIAQVKSILKEETYIGHSVHNKQSNISFKNKKKVRKPQEEWYRVENTHEAIISEEVFQKVQELIASRRRKRRNGTTQIFAGLIKCADCGWSLAYGENKQNKNPYGYYHCSKNGQGLRQCSMHYIRYDVLYAYVLARLQYWSMLAQKDEDKLLKRLLNVSDRERNSAKKKQAAELKKAEKRKAEVDGLFAKMYEDWSAGRITEYNFNMLSEKYQNEQKELEAKIRQLHETMEAAVQTAADAEKWIALMKQYVNPVELTAELLNTLIEKITVHEAVKGEDGSREQEVEIYYRFIGKID